MIISGTVTARNVAIASTPFIAAGGHYTGIDVGEKEIRFDVGHYPRDQYSFVHSADQLPSVCLHGPRTALTASLRQRSHLPVSMPSFGVNGLSRGFLFDMQFLTSFFH